ncbi:MAG: DUF4296 domain-containing protein [Kaistella sp.]
MKRLWLFFFSFLMMSCSELIDPPKNLIEKDEMSEIIAEFALNDQFNNFLPQSDLENATRLVLKRKKIKAQDFTESYKYYIATGELEEILNDAQKIILAKDPAAKDYIDKKLKENQNVPAFAR